MRAYTPHHIMDVTGVTPETLPLIGLIRADSTRAASQEQLWLPRWNAV